MTYEEKIAVLTETAKCDGVESEEGRMIFARLCWYATDYHEASNVTPTRILIQALGYTKYRISKELSILEVAEQNDAQAEKWREEGGEEWGKTTACRECAADHRQLAEWLTELKQWRRVYGICPSYEMCIPECREGYNAQIAEYKRLLKAAVEDFRWLESHTEDGKGHCCISGDNNELACIHCPLNQRNKDTIMCGWNYEAEALALIGEDGDING